MIYTKRVRNNETTQKEIFISRILNPFCKVANIEETQLANTLFTRFDIYHNSYADDNIYWSADGYWEKVVIPHKIAVYQSGIELLKKVQKLNAYFVNEADFIKRLIEHDLSKFSAIETIGYMNYNFKGENSDSQKEDFALSWHHHKQHNSHHPEYWLDVDKKGAVEVLPMKTIDTLEMVADWIGAGKSYSTPFEEWANNNLHRFLFHPKTQRELTIIFRAIGFRYYFDGI